MLVGQGPVEPPGPDRSEQLAGVEAAGHGHIDGQQLEHLGGAGAPEALGGLLGSGGGLVGQPHELLGPFTQGAQRFGAGHEHRAGRSHGGERIQLDAQAEPPGQGLGGAGQPVPRGSSMSLPDVAGDGHGHAEAGVTRKEVDEAGRVPRRVQQAVERLPVGDVVGPRTGAGRGPHGDPQDQGAIVTTLVTVVAAGGAPGIPEVVALGEEGDRAPRVEVRHRAEGHVPFPVR